MDSTDSDYGNVTTDNPRHWSATNPRKCKDVESHYIPWGRCPHCGYCPTCGRPYQGYNPWSPFWVSNNHSVDSGDY